MISLTAEYLSCHREVDNIEEKVRAIIEDSLILQISFGLCWSQTVVTLD